jgi:signal transduction histidine kinase
VDHPFRPFRTGSDADLAFAIMVLAAYFTTFSVMDTATSSQLLWMIALGVAYIAAGIYGYAIVSRSGIRSLQIVYFAGQLLLAGAIIYIGKGEGYNAMVLLPLAGQSVMLLPRAPRLVVNLAIVVTFVLAMNPFGVTWNQVWAGLPVFMAGQIFIVVFTQMAVSEERARSEVELLVGELERANGRLRSYAMQVEELAIAKERNRIAREIHDGLGHYLTTIFIQIQAARAVMKVDPAKSMDALGAAQNQTQEALQDVRRSVSALRDLPGDRLSIEEEIRRMLKSCEGSGLHQELKVLGTPRLLNPQTLLTIYRTVQEGINNVVKHARASHITVTLDFTQSNQVRLVVQDDGLGAERMDGGFGLLGIRERVQMLEGEVQTISRPGNGFALEICVPG